MGKGGWGLGQGPRAVQVIGRVGADRPGAPVRQPEPDRLSRMTIAGGAPAASSALAMMFMATELVML